MQNYIDEDTISLLDIWHILKKRKLLFWMVFLLGLAISIIFIAMRTPHYSYAQIIEVPSYLEKKAVKQVWPSDFAVEKIKKFYFPMAELKYNSIHKNEPMHLKASSLVTDDLEGYISLSLDGSIKAIDAYRKILQTVLENMQMDAAAILAEKANNLKLALADLQIRKEQIVNGLKFLTKKKNSTGILLSNEYMRAALQIDQQINEVNYKLKSLRQATASELVRSNLPVGPSKMVLLVLFIFVSLLFSFFAVFVAEFIEKISRQ